MKNDNSGNQLILSRKLYVDYLNKKRKLFCFVFRRKYQAGVMLGGTSQIFLQAKTHSK